MVSQMWPEEETQENKRFRKTRLIMRTGLGTPCKATWGKTGGSEEAESKSEGKAGTSPSLGGPEGKARQGG